MRLYLLPISTRRTLLYAKRLHIITASPTSASYLDRGVGFAAKTWANWESQNKGWKRKVVDWGNNAFRRIPYQEWGLKSVPPLSARRKAEELTGEEKVEVVFPKSAIPVTKAEGILRTLGTERQTLHSSRLRWCFVGMPITAPFALVPVIPNLPFFYLVYRAWSHWRALSGGKHIQWLVDNKLVAPSPSEALDKLYESKASAVDEKADDNQHERLLLNQDDVKEVARTLELPELEVELERALWQVETELKEKSQAKDTNKDSRSDPKIIEKDEEKH